MQSSNQVDVHGAVHAALAGSSAPNGEPGGKVGYAGAIVLATPPLVPVAFPPTRVERALRLAAPASHGMLRPLAGPGGDSAAVPFEQLLGGRCTCGVVDRPQHFEPQGGLGSEQSRPQCCPSWRMRKALAESSGDAPASSDTASSGGRNFAFAHHCRYEKLSCT